MKSHKQIKKRKLLDKEEQKNPKEIDKNSPQQRHRYKLRRREKSLASSSITPLTLNSCASTNLDQKKSFTAQLSTSIPALLESALTFNKDGVLYTHGTQDFPLQLSYHFLLTHAKHLAAILQHNGVIPANEIRVGICLERGPQLIIACLAVWLAGGTLVALEHQEQCDSMIQYKVKLAEINLFICETKTIEQVSQATTHTNPVLINVNKLPSKKFIYNRSLLTTLKPSCAAYIAFTSGSTGKPKGVIVEYAALLNLAASMNNLRLTRVKVGLHSKDILEHDAVLINAAATFDAFISELLLGIMTPRMHIAIENLRRNVRKIEHIINNYSITISIFSADLAQKINLDVLAKLTDFLSMGSSPGNFLHDLVKKNHRLIVRNEIGFTEAGVKNTDNPIYFDIYDESVAYSVGKPIQGCNILVLDPETLEISNVGELYCSGICLARGYLKNPEATAKSFVTLAFDHEENRYYPITDQHTKGLKTTRFYRTGDKGEILADGNIAFRGRIDREIKISGYRINLGAIERYIKQCPGIKAVAIIALKKQNTYHTAALVEPIHETTLLKEMIYQTLRDTPLLHIAYPHLILFQEIPITKNAKIDYRAVETIIKLHIKDSPHSCHEIIAPNSFYETRIADICSKILSIPAEEISINDSIFDYGLASDDTLRLVQSLSHEFKLKSPHDIVILDIYSNPTISELSRLINNKREAMRNSRSKSSKSTPEFSGFGLQKQNPSIFSLRKEIQPTLPEKLKTPSLYPSTASSSDKPSVPEFRK